MKTKCMLVMMFIILIPQILSAQVLRNYGVKAEFTSSGIYNEVLNEGFSRRPGFGFAVFAEVFNNPVFSVLFQAEYAQRGFLEEQAETNESGDFIQTVKANTRLDYLSFPILAKLRYTKGRYTPYVIFGPRLDFLLNKRNGKFRFTVGSFESET
ncbi:outer membrane beta-barrel protein, partial [candidate division KSB1 bacterium]